MKLTRHLFSHAIVKICMITAGLLLWVFISQAQETRIITGTVTDSSGTPLQGTSVAVKNSKTGTTTDAQGNYSIAVTGNADAKALVFSFAGFISQQILIGSNTTINVSLKSNIETTLEDIVVVGYGTQRKVSLTGAVSQVGSENIENKPVTNALQALQGEAPNLIIQQPSLEPGSGVNLNIRGIGTTGDNTPLIVVDGIIGGNINTINPNDIASVSVLKDAGSAAIYGSRAANGVILVTTKSGRLNQKPTVSYDGSFGIQVPRVLVEKVSAWDNAYYKNLALINSDLPPAYTPEQIQKLKEQGNGTWDVEHLLKNAPMQQHTLNISGGGENNSYYISGGYQNQGSNLIGNGGSGKPFGYQVYNLRLNQSSIIGRLKTNIILNYTKTRNKTNTVGNNNIFADANRVPLNYSWTDSAGNFLTNDVASQYNEYGVLMKGGFGQSDNDEIFGNFNAQLTLAKGLKLTGVFGGTLNSYNLIFRRQQVSYLPSGIYGDDRTVFDNNSKSQLFNTQLFAEYSNAVKNHYFKILFGGSNENYRQQGSQVQKLYTDQYLGTPTTGTIVDPLNSYNSIAVNESSISSLFGRVNYSFANKYLLEGNFRVDASSRFAKGNRTGFFPSISAGWVVSDEQFMASLNKAINHLKIRATYGVLGNQNVGAYQYQATYFNYAAAYGYNNSVVGGAGYVLGNPDLTWEKAATLNLGMDLGLFNNRLTFAFDYFDKKTTDILQSRQDVPLIFGLSTFPDYNVAAVRNRGWEAQATYKLVSGKLTQSFSVNIADTKNELLRLTGGATEQIINQDVYSLLRRVGQPITQYYGFVTNGFFQNNADVQSSAKPSGVTVGPGDIKFKDLNNDGKIDDADKTVLGNPFPRYTFGFTYRLDYKGFDMQLFIQGVGKRDQFLRGELVEPFHYNYGATVYTHQTNFWTPDNPDARYPRLAVIGSQSNSNNWRLGSDMYKYDAAYVRLKNINLGYTLPASVTQKWSVKRLRVSFIGQNLVTLSKLTFIDPETTEFDNRLNLGNASNSARTYPLPVFYGGSIEITF
ncbi:SusC/RagA family TonB-linked outer membrane protein [Niabella aquatica]